MGKTGRRASEEEIGRLLAEIDRIAERIGVKPNVPPRWDPECYLDIDERGYHLVMFERGVESKRSTAATLDEFLFALFDMATRGQGGNRSDRVDSRRLDYPRQLELLARHSADWADRARKTQERDLAHYPFDDARYYRLSFVHKLEAEGQGAAEAKRLADERYPRPKPVDGD